MFRRVSTPVLIALFYCSLIATITVTGVLMFSVSVPSQGGIHSPVTSSPEIQIFSNAACTNAFTQVHWGDIVPGDSSTVQFFIKNIGVSTVILSLDGVGWQPSGATDFLVLSWNYDGDVLLVGGVLSVAVSLHVSSGVSGFNDFSVNIVVTASNLE